MLCDFCTDRVEALEYADHVRVMHPEDEALMKEETPLSSVAA